MLIKLISISKLFFYQNSINQLNIIKMKNLSNLIKGLQLIQETEKNSEIPFNSQNSKLFIGELSNYSENQIYELENLGFYVNYEFDCFEYDLD